MKRSFNEFQNKRVKIEEKSFCDVDFTFNHDLNLEKMLLQKFNENKLYFKKNFQASTIIWEELKLYHHKLLRRNIVYRFDFTFDFKFPSYYFIHIKINDYEIELEKINQFLDFRKDLFIFKEDVKIYLFISSISNFSLDYGIKITNIE